MGIEALQLSSQAVVLPQEERVHAGQLQHLTRTGVTWQGHTWHRSGNVTLGSAHRGIFRCLDICVVRKWITNTEEEKETKDWPAPDWTGHSCAENRREVGKVSVKGWEHQLKKLNTRRCSPGSHIRDIWSHSSREKCK